MRSHGRAIVDFDVAEGRRAPTAWLQMAAHSRSATKPWSLVRCPTGRQHAPDNRYHASKRKKPAAVRDGQPPRGREQQCPGNNCPHAGQADNRDPRRIARIPATSAMARRPPHKRQRLRRARRASAWETRGRMPTAHQFCASPALIASERKLWRPDLCFGVQYRPVRRQPCLQARSALPSSADQLVRG